MSKKIALDKINFYMNEEDDNLSPQLKVANIVIHNNGETIQIEEIDVMPYFYIEYYKDYMKTDYIDYDTGEIFRPESNEDRYGYLLTYVSIYNHLGVYKNETEFVNYIDMFGD